MGSSVLNANEARQMPTISLDEAAGKITHEVEGMTVDDVVEVYNELFPEEPAAEDAVNGNLAPLVAQIVDHIQHGIEPEELVDLWNVVFPKDRQVYYDEESGLVHYEDVASDVGY